MKRKWFLILVIFGLISSNAVFGQSNKVILFQAEVANQSRQLLDDTSTYQVTFSIWDSISGGAQLWQQVISGIVFKKGSISVLLGGTAAPFPSSLFTTDTTYLQMVITKAGVSETLSPRMRITSSAYMIAGIETTGCPSGMTKVNDFCIDINRSGPVSEKNALSACHARGARLCRWWQLQHACELNLLDVNHGTAFSSELTSDAGPSAVKGTWAVPDAVASLPSCDKLDAPSVLWGSSVYIFYYRCCQ